MSKEILKSYSSIQEDRLQNVIEDMKTKILAPAIIFLNGDLGSGKTFFINKWAQYVEGELSLSPSYALINEGQNFLHADFYRLEDPLDLRDLNLDLYGDHKNYFFIEWGKKFSKEIIGQLPSFHHCYELEIKFSSKDSNARDYFFSKLLVDDTRN